MCYLFCIPMNMFSLFAVLLLVTQASVPTTGKAANNGTRNSHTQNEGTDGGKNPAATLVSLHTKEGYGTTLKTDAEKYPADNNQSSINITNVVPVPVAWGKREWAIWGANLALALVGIGGIVVAIFTLCFIKRQAVEMRRQRITMVKTLIAIKEQAKSLNQQNDMIVSKERARLRVELEKLPDEWDGFPALPIKLTIPISGSTEASIRKTRYMGLVVQKQETVIFRDAGEQMLDAPEAISPVDRFVGARGYVFNAGEGFGTVYTGDSFVYVKGAVHYTDVFNGKWVFRFSRRYKFVFYPKGKIIGGSWENYGEEGDNGEYPDL
jgi:hypothetical protein